METKKGLPCGMGTGWLNHVGEALGNPASTPVVPPSSSQPPPLSSPFRLLARFHSFSCVMVYAILKEYFDVYLVLISVKPFRVGILKVSCLSGFSLIVCIIWIVMRMGKF